MIDTAKSTIRDLQVVKSRLLNKEREFDAIFSNESVDLNQKYTNSIELLKKFISYQNKII